LLLVSSLSQIGEYPLICKCSTPVIATTVGGWQPFHGVRLGDDNVLHYPGDSPQRPLAQLRLRDELITFYDGFWVAVIHADPVAFMAPSPDAVSSRRRRIARSR
jgi:hypothetical protein